MFAGEQRCHIVVSNHGTRRTWMWHRCSPAWPSNAGGTSMPSMRAGRPRDRSGTGGDVQALVVPGQRIEFEPDGQPREFWLLGADGSSARQTIDSRGTPVVYQHGPRLLWDILEAAHQDWTATGSPPRQDFGLTVAATGTHTLWHAQDRDTRWTLA